MSKADSRSPAESAVVEQVYLVFPNDLNANDTVFGGQIMALMDRYCAVVADRHAGTICVTVGVDAVHFVAPARRGDVLIFNATVNRAWRTSMEVGCKVEAQDAQHGPRRHILSAYLPFVGTGKDRRPVPIPSLAPESADEKRRHQEAEMRRAMRLQHAADLKALRAQRDT